MSNTQSDTKQWLIGVDVGGTTISTLIVDQHFYEKGQLTITTDLTSPDHTLTSIVNAIEQTLHLTGAKRAEVAAIGIGIPGQVNPATGDVKFAVNLKWDNFAAGKALQDRLGIPCFLENDVRAATLGLYRFYNQASQQNMIYVNIGTGVAAGVILAGNLYRGTHGMAGEIGHMIVEPNGPRCNCGAYGCLETFIGGPAIASQAQTALQSNPTTRLRDYPNLTARGVYQAAQAGDAVATKIINQAGHYLGQALQNVVMTYDIERIVLGGGVTKAGDHFLHPIKEEWRRLRQHSALARQMLNLEMLHVVNPTQNMGIWGAVALAEQEMKLVKVESSLKGNGKFFAVSL